jgi:hypothetical protein
MGRLSKVDLLVRVLVWYKKKIMFGISNAAGLNKRGACTIKLFMVVIYGFL